MRRCRGASRRPAAQRSSITEAADCTPVTLHPLFCRGSALGYELWRTLLLSPRLRGDRRRRRQHVRAVDLGFESCSPPVRSPGRLWGATGPLCADPAASRAPRRRILADPSPGDAISNRPSSVLVDSIRRSASTPVAVRMTRSSRPLVARLRVSTRAT